MEEHNFRIRFSSFPFCCSLQSLLANFLTPDSAVYSTRFARETCLFERQMAKLCGRIHDMIPWRCNMSALVRFRFPHGGCEKMNVLLSLIVRRRLFIQRGRCGLIDLPSSITIFLSSARNKHGSFRGEKYDKHQNVLLVNETGTSLGEKSFREAVVIAREKSMELVRMDRDEHATDMPVYKMMRKIDLRVKTTKTFRMKNIEVSDKIEPKDLNVKVNQIQKWLEKGHQVRVNVKSKGSNQEDKWKIMRQLEQEVEEKGTPIGSPTEDTPVQISCTFKPGKVGAVS